MVASVRFPIIIRKCLSAVRTVWLYHPVSESQTCKIFSTQTIVQNRIMDIVKETRIAEGMAAT